MFEDIKNTDSSVRKRKLACDFDYTTSEKTTVASKRLKPNVNLSMSFGSPRLVDTSNNALTAPVSQKKSTLFDYGFCKKGILRRSFSTSEATIKAAFEKGEINLKYN